MPNTAWRCEDASGDVKYAVRLDHKLKLEDRGYTCALDPDADFNTLVPVDLDSDDGTG